MIRFWTKEDQEYWNKPEHQLMFEWDLLWTSENIWDRTEEHTKLRKEKLIDLFKRFIDAVMKANPVVNRVMPKIAGIIWEQRYSKTLDNDKFGRWMRIGRINGMTIATITKAEVENKPTRYVVRLPNDTGDESLQNDLITLSENEAMLEAEKYIAKYVSNFWV